MAELQRARAQRVGELHELGVDGACLYGRGGPGATGGLGDLNAFFLLTDAPEVYNLPARADPAGAPHRARAWLAGLAAMAGLAVAALALFARRD